LKRAEQLAILRTVTVGEIQKILQTCLTGAMDLSDSLWRFAIEDVRVPFFHVVMCDEA
jgi:hypothetical protein